MPRAREGPVNAADMPMTISPARGVSGKRRIRPATSSARPRHITPFTTRSRPPLADALSQEQDILSFPPLVLQTVHERARQVDAESADRPVVQRSRGAGLRRL